MIAANAGHAPAYGSDSTTDHAVAAFRRELGNQVDVFMTFNGTGANVVGLQSLMHTWEAVICASTAHINVDEGGAPEKLLGSKIINLQTSDGKLTPDLIASVEWRVGDVHQSQPKVVLLARRNSSDCRYRPRTWLGLVSGRSPNR